MFSKVNYYKNILLIKAGRHTTEKFIIFSKKDEILYNKKKKFRAKLIPDIEFKLS